MQGQTRAIAIDTLIIAGWAGRDEAGIAHHIEELQAIGVPPPSTTPLFYRAGAQMLTQDARIDVLGPDSSGEVEPIIISAPDGLWLGIGSDHTDRKLETVGIALSKQICPKPIGAHLWPLEDVAGHWDDLVVRSFATIGGERVLYQEGTLAALRTAHDLIARLPGGHLPVGALMFGGTVPTRDGIFPADLFEMELHDPKTGLVLNHAYGVHALPIVA